MPFQGRLADRLEEIRQLNRLFLTYAQACAREDRSALALPSRVARRLAEAEPKTLERIADLPAALFRLNLGLADGTRDRAAFGPRADPLRLSVALTILNSAWHMARERSFEARMFLHLTTAALHRLRLTPLSGLQDLAADPGLLRCAFSEGRFTWPALFRDDEPDTARMLTLIALQPNLGGSRATAHRAAGLELRSLP